MRTRLAAWLPTVALKFEFFARLGRSRWLIRSRTAQAALDAVADESVGPSPSCAHVAVSVSEPLSWRLSKISATEPSDIFLVNPWAVTSVWACAPGVRGAELDTEVWCVNITFGALAAAS